MAETPEILKVNKFDSLPDVLAPNEMYFIKMPGALFASFYFTDPQSNPIKIFDVEAAGEVADNKLTDYFTKDEITALLSSVSSPSAIFNFTNAANVVCNHNFGKPSVTVQIFDNTGKEIFASVTKTDNNTLVVSLQPATSGQIIIKS